MLKDWPVENLLWWSCWPDTDSRFGQQTVHHRVAHLPGRLRPLRRFTRQKAWILEHFWVRRAAAHLDRMLSECQPDVVWAIPHDWSIPPLALALQRRRLGIHVSIHDYVDVHGHSEKFGPQRCQRMVTQVEQLYAAATTRDAISRSMVDDLRCRTGRDASQILRAGLEPEDIAWLLEKRSAPADEVRIAYAGTILVPDVFAHFVTALGRIRPILGRPVRLELFGSHSYAQQPWFDPEWMHEHGNLPEAKLLQELRRCTWGFSPMSLTDEDPRYNRFSFPTKFITYLAAGLPILIVGHPESSVARIASQYSVGVLETSDALEALEQKLQSALSVPNPWELYRDEILRCAKAEFDAHKMRTKLHACFTECSSVTRSIE